MFLAVQLIRPTIPRLPVTADLMATREIKQILRKSCYDCHSNETRLAWFDEIVPVYWLVAHDVQSGRTKLNFSEIGRLPATQQRAALYEVVNQIHFGAMPLPAYTRLHRAALITAAELNVLKSYLNPATAGCYVGPWRHGLGRCRVRGMASRRKFKSCRWRRRSTAFSSRTITRIGKQSVQRIVSTIKQCA